MQLHLLLIPERGPWVVGWAELSLSLIIAYSFIIVLGHWAYPLGLCQVLCPIGYLWKLWSGRSFRSVLIHIFLPVYPWARHHLYCHTRMVLLSKSHFSLLAQLQLCEEWWQIFGFPFKIVLLSSAPRVFLVNMKEWGEWIVSVCLNLAALHLRVFELRIKTFGLLCFPGPVCQLSPGLILAPFLTAYMGEENLSVKRHKSLFGQPWYFTWGIEEFLLQSLLSRPVV